MFNNKKNVLKHLAIDDVYPDISPAKSFIPEWYKKADRFTSGQKVPTRQPYPSTFKLCAAFADAFTTGYMIPTPVDLSVEQTEGGPSVSWGDPNMQFLEIRDRNHNKEVPTPAGFADIHFAWKTQHLFKIPKGYTALLTHPFNRFDLPFLTLSGFIDGEMAVHKGNIPVYFNSTFEGLIPAGTPFAQLVLFKTENWISEKDVSLFEEADRNSRHSLNIAMGWYKRNIWQKKTFD